MSTPTIAIIPLDDRSVNYECLRLLGEAAGCDVLLPPKAWLGTSQRTGDMARLSAWLLEQAPRADALIVAIDTLGYGGLVNSRRSTDSSESVLQRLHCLHEIKQAQPLTTLLAFSVLMRITRGNDAEEEKAYWADYGARIFRLSYLEDRAAMAVGAPAEAEEIATLRNQIPPALIEDFQAGRARNHAVNRTMIDWAADGLFDYLIIPQDDTVDFGWNIAESRRLRRHAGERGAGDRISIYPGADETAMLLLARYAAQRTGYTPRVRLRYSGSASDQVITAYEDRPMTEMVKAHLGPLSGIVTEEADADIVLYVNAPAEVQGNGPDQWALGLTDAQVAALPPASQQALERYRQQSNGAATLREMHTVRRDLSEFVRSLNDDLRRDRTCAVVDVAFVNAGDKALGDLLVRLPEVSRLAAYGGWNTAGNTLGCVLSQAVIRHLQVQLGASAAALAAHVRFLFLRIVEDYLFMAQLRSQIAVQELPALGLPITLGNLGEHAETVRAIVAHQLAAAAALLASERFAGRRIAAGESAILLESLSVTGVELPWDRLFDLTMEVEARYPVP
ncbi:MAG: DUF4127 family protein [Caldilineaceae bacterium]|nr:DUF4127 family protein [Caldilineaceae bacterium]